MKTICNNSSNPITVDSIVYPPGVSYAPGVGVVLVDQSFVVHVETPDLARSFGMGLLVVVPVISVFWAMRLARMLKPSFLDRYT